MRNFEDLTVSDYLRIIRRRIWYLILPTILVSVGGAVYVWRMPSIYKSETTILVTDRILPEDYIGSIIRQSIADRIEFAKQQLRSRTFVERIAQEFQLVGTGANADAVLNAVIDSTDITVVPPNVFKVGFYSSDPNVAQAVTRRLAERVMQSNETLRQERVSVADQFIDDQVRQASDDVAQAEQKLRDFNQRHFPGVPQEGVAAETLNALQSQLAVVETDLQNGIEQRKAFERSLVEQRDLKVASQTPRPPEKNAALSPAASPAAPVRSPLEQKLILKKAELSELSAKYTPLHPDVGRVKREIRDLESQLSASNATAATASTPDPAPASPPIKSEVNPLPELDYSVDFYEAEIRRELDQLNREMVKREGTRKDLTDRLALYGRRLNMPPEVMQELSTLTQERETAKQRFTLLSTKKLTSDLAGKADTNTNNKTFTTIDPPNLPQVPLRPNRQVLTAVGCLAGLMLGAVLVVARELLDPTVRDRESAAAELQMPVLASIPTVGNGRMEKKIEKQRRKKTLAMRKQQLVVASSQPHLSADFSIQDVHPRIREVISGRHTIAREQLLMLRAELVKQSQRGLKSLVVASAVPSEGKTFIACCVAGILAKEQGKKVLLIDGDLRTGNAGHVMGLGDRSSQLGFTDVLNGSADVENCLKSCKEINLSFLPAGTFIDNPVELLSSPRLQQVIRDLTLLFDWVIMDSAPLLPIADTTLLVPICDTAILVVRADRTPVSVAEEVINKIGRDRLSGMIVNGVRDMKSTHYYGQYYHGLAKETK